MRKLIAGILAGILLGTSTTAIAAQKYGYWEERGNDYSCQGYGKAVMCKSSGYEFGTTTNYVFIKKIGRNQMYGCEKWQGWYSCTGN